MSQDARTKTTLQRLSGDVQEFDLEELLTPGRVTLHISSSASGEPQAQLLLSFAANLLARLHPVVQSLCISIPRDASLIATIPRWHGESLADHISEMVTAINPPISWNVEEKAPADNDFSLTNGPTSAGANNIFVGSNGWETYFSPDEPVSVTGSINPVGAYAAACVGVSEIWKRLLVQHQETFKAFPIIPQTTPLTFSCYSYLANKNSYNPPLPKTINLSLLTLAGLGAGGGATAYTLASLPDLKGSINLIDPDEVEDTNLNRYIFADETDAKNKQPKTDVVLSIFRQFKAIEIMPFPLALKQAAAHLKSDDYRYVAAAMHSREARRELQFETPMVLWDCAAAEDGEFRVWRMILGKTECMHCKHPAGAGDPEQDKAAQLAELLGLDAATYLLKIRDHEPFSRDEISTISNHLRDKEIDFDIPEVGQRFNDWETSQCGKLPLPDVDDEVPIPFAPVMAGVLIAGEIIKEHYFPDSILDSRYWNTLLGNFMKRNRPHRRRPREDCAFCYDADYMAQFHRRWKK